MLIIDIIKQHVQKTEGTIPEWANYITQDSSKRIQYWERKPKSWHPSYNCWENLSTTDSIADFDVSDFCEDWKTPLKITDYIRNYVNQPETTVKESSEVGNNPYRKPFTNRMEKYWSMDVYDICKAFNLDPITSHGVKKLLVSGGRNGGKSEIQDLKEAIWSIEERIKELENN